MIMQADNENIDHTHAMMGTWKYNDKKIQSTLVISNSKGLTETLRDIRTSTYQSWESE